MLRLLGAVLIVCGSAAWGVTAALRLRRRAAVLSALCSALEVMRCEIGGRMSPLPELFERLERDTPAPLSGFFAAVRRDLETLGERTFAQLWEANVRGARQLLLTPTEERLLADLGRTLGQYPANEQLGAIAYTEKRLEKYAAEAREDSRRDARMRACLGLAAGLFAVLILL